jgi:hypothetical protein
VVPFRKNLSCVFTLEKVRLHNIIPSARPLPGTTNEGQTLGFQVFHPGNRDYVLEEHHHKCNPQALPPPLAKAAAARYQTPDTPVSPIVIACNTSLRHFNLLHSHHDFLHLCQYLGNQNFDMSHGTNMTAMLRATSS